MKVSGSFFLSYGLRDVIVEIRSGLAAGLRLEAAGTFKVMVKTGPVESEVEFTVLDIPVTFSLLLGRPWFHPLGGIPSTQH